MSSMNLPEPIDGVFHLCSTPPRAFDTLMRLLDMTRPFQDRLEMQGQMENPGLSIEGLLGLNALLDRFGGTPPAWDLLKEYATAYYMYLTFAALDGGFAKEWIRLSKTLEKLYNLKQLIEVLASDVFVQHVPDARFAARQ